ncbi:unnamed protein product [Ectocarpus sp. 13 AM-2016]
MLDVEMMRVFGRVRPPVLDSLEERKALDLAVSDGSPEQPTGTPCIESWNSNGTIVYSQGARREFQFTGCFGAEHSQEEIFNNVGAGVVDGIIDGCNGTILCTGRRGSGKTYTLCGSGPAGGEEEGILARSMTRLFSCLKKTRGRHVSVRVSLLRVYCETLQDMLDRSSKRDILIREKSSGETFLEGLSSRTVRGSAEAISIFERAQFDEGSSRGHTIALVYLEQRRPEEAHRKGGDGLTQSCLMLADLAASESAKRTEARYQRLEECKFVNLGLSALGNCMAALAKGQAHVPFRDSKLTRLLQQTLAGNSKTAVIVGIISERDELGETLATLIFAQRAMSVMTEARANVVPDLEARCQDLQQQYDNQSDKLTQMTLMKASAEERLEVARDQLAQLQEEKNATDVRLQTMVEAYDMLTEPSSEDAVSTTDTTQQQEWKERARNMKAECDRNMKSLKQGYEERVQAYKAEAARAAAQCCSSDYELTKEKEAHLQVARDLRVCHSEGRRQERETNRRISELLKELADRDAVVEDMEARIRVLENQAVQQNAVLAKEYVSRHQVNEMETLFGTAVEDLSNRLKDMEKRKTDVQRQGNEMSRAEALGPGRDLNGVRAPGRRRGGSQAGAATFC